MADPCQDQKDALKKAINDLKDAKGETWFGLFKQSQFVINQLAEEVKVRRAALIACQGADKLGLGGLANSFLNWAASD